MCNDVVFAHQNSLKVAFSEIKRFFTSLLNVKTLAALFHVKFSHKVNDSQGTHLHKSSLQ